MALGGVPREQKMLKGHPCSRGGRAQRHLTYSINTWCAITLTQNRSELEHFSINILQALDTERWSIAFEAANMAVQMVYYSQQDPTVW